MARRWCRAQVVCAASGGVIFLGGAAVANVGAGSAWTVSALRQRPPELTLHLIGGQDPGWIRAGDVLRFRVTLSGSMRRARVALAAVPPSAPLTVACPRTAAASPAGQVCDLGRVRDGREMEVGLTVPSDARQLALTAVAHIRRPAGSRMRWLSRSSAVIIGTHLTSPDAPLKAAHQDS
jgi:hypothetical protein